MPPKTMPTKKQQNKKKPNNGTPKQSISLFTKMLFFTTAASVVAVAVTSYFVYNKLTESPPLPQIDLDYWWGAYPMDPKQDKTIRPYRIEFSDVMINDLQERLLHRRPFVPPLENSGFTYGFNSAFLTRVLDYWQTEYDFKQREAFLNKYDQFVTNIQGLDVHYIHVKPKVQHDVKVIPVLLLHGWPGSVREFYDIIPKLTEFRSGYRFVFEIVAPSLPGYGFSQATQRPGLGALEMAVIMKNLMERIGINKYYVQGGDWGHVIGSEMATIFPDKVLGFHTNMPVLLFQPAAFFQTLLGSVWPSLVIEKELVDRMYPLSKYLSNTLEETGYMHLQATKPDTVGIALTDSPAGLAAYILEKFSTWTNPAYKVASDGELLKNYSLTNLLDNIMIYWTTNSITTSMRMYAETLGKRQMMFRIDEIPTDVPTWGIKFRHELAFTPDTILKSKYKNYLQSTNVEVGGHFAAFENPEILSKDLYDAVEAFEEFHGNNLSHKVNQDKTVDSTETPQTIYEFSAKDINGKPVKLDKYKGHVCIIVNVASNCGLTDKNYQQLNELYEKYEQSGLRILAFPSNQFNGQEPGDSKEIFNFVKQKNVKFDVFEKIDVNGDNAHPLYKFLKSKLKGTMGDFIKWNFSKFIIDKNGVPVERLSPHVNPLDLEPYLAKYL